MVQQTCAAPPALHEKRPGVDQRVEGKDSAECGAGKSSRRRRALIAPRRGQGCTRGLEEQNTVRALDKETLDKESRVSRPMDGWSWATHLASEQEGMRQGLAPQEDIPYPTPPP